MSYKDKETLQTMYWDHGMSSKEIANEFGVTSPTILSWMDKLGVEKRDATYISEQSEAPPQVKDEEWMYEKYIEQGYSVNKIATIAGTTKTTANRWLDNHGIKKRDRSKTRVKYDKLTDESWLRKQLIEKGLTQVEVAEMVGGDPAVVSQWMKRHGISVDGVEGPNTGGETVLSKGPNWDEQREKRLRVDNYECQDCGAESGPNGISLDVHHKVERTHFVDENNNVDWDRANDIDNLVTLCRSCHLKRPSN